MLPWKDGKWRWKNLLKLSQLEACIAVKKRNCLKTKMSSDFYMLCYVRHLHDSIRAYTHTIVICKHMMKYSDFEKGEKILPFTMMQMS